MLSSNVAMMHFRIPSVTLLTSRFALPLNRSFYHFAFTVRLKVIQTSGSLECSSDLLGGACRSLSYFPRASRGGFARVLRAGSGRLRRFLRPFGYPFSCLLAALANLPGGACRSSSCFLCAFRRGFAGVLRADSGFPGRFF